MRKFASVLALAVLVSSFAVLRGGNDQPVKKGKRPKGDDNKVSQLMHQKLECSQNVLEGIAVGNFDEIRKNARELLDISKNLEWNVINTPEYTLHSNQFRRELENLGKNAKDKNLDAAALSYVEVTLTCVRCHKYVREVRMTRGDDVKPSLATLTGSR